MKRKQFVNYLLWFIILCWAGMATVYWALAPHIAAFTNASFHSSAYQIIKGTGSIGLDLLVIILAYFLGKKRNTEYLVVTGWSLTWFVSVFTFVISAACCHIFNYGTFTPTIFNSLFPLIRNTYPLIFGLLLGLLLTRIIDQLDNGLQKGILYGIWFLITIPLFSAPNMFGWNEQALTIFYSLLPVLGARFDKSDSWTTKRWCFITIGLWMLDLILEFLIPFMTASPQNITRFSLSSSIFIVLTAYGLFKILLPYLTSINILFAFTYLTLIQNTALTSLLSATLAIRTNYATVKTGI